MDFASIVSILNHLFSQDWGIECYNMAMLLGNDYLSPDSLAV